MKLLKYVLHIHSAFFFFFFKEKDVSKTTQFAWVICRKKNEIWKWKSLFWHSKRPLKETHVKLNIFLVINWLRLLKKKKKVVIFPLEHSSWGLTLGSSNADTACPVSWFFTERNWSPERGSAAVNSPPSGDRGGHPWPFAPTASQAQCSPGLEKAR